MRAKLNTLFKSKYTETVCPCVLTEGTIVLSN
jgi:hypothetical protein